MNTTKRFGLWLAASFLFLQTTAVQAQESYARPETVRGVVQAIDYASGVILIHDGHGRDRTIITSPSTTITESGESGYEELSDIRRGNRLIIEGSRVDSRIHAAIIKIRHARSDDAQ